LSALNLRSWLSWFPLSASGGIDKDLVRRSPKGHAGWCDASSLPAQRFIVIPTDLEGKIVKDGVRKALTQRQTALADLVHAVRQYQAPAEKQPLTLQGAHYANAVHELNPAIGRADGLL
jgi:hypothetical protein